jgi:WD40 repeat protein
MSPAHDEETNRQPEHTPIREPRFSRRTALLLPALLAAGGQLLGRAHPGHAAAPPSPLDTLDPSRIPVEERYAWQPQELAAVLGTHRGRHWCDVKCVAFSPDGWWIATSSHAAVRLWDPVSLREAAVLEGHTYYCNGGPIAFAPDGKTLASPGRDRAVHLWDLSGATPRLGARLEQACEPHSLAFSPDGKTLATTDSLAEPDDSLVLWDIVHGRRLRTWSLPRHHADHLAFAPDGKRLTVFHAVRYYRDDDRVGLFNSLRLWDLETEPPVERAVLRFGCRCLAFSPDGKTVALDGMNQTVRLKDIATGQDLALVRGHTDWVQALAFSPDGKTLASGSLDQTIRLWDLGGGQLRARATLRGHTGSVDSLAFSLDGRTLASGGGDRTLRLWDVESGRPRAPSPTPRESRPTPAVARRSAPQRESGSATIHWPP